MIGLEDFIQGKWLENASIEDFFTFFSKWFKGPFNAYMREVFVSLGDPKTSTIKERKVLTLEEALELLKKYVKTVEDLRKINIYVGVGYFKNGVIPSKETILYDRLVFDIDKPHNPLGALKESLRLIIENELFKNAKTMIAFTGFKGVHLIIPLPQPVNWTQYQVLFEHFGKALPEGLIEYVDRNMLQWNRVDRLPLSFNIKENEARFCPLVPYLTWDKFDWDIGTMPTIKTTKLAPLEITPLKRVDVNEHRDWLTRVKLHGLPDGRKRFLLSVLIPYLAVFKKLDVETVVNECKEFIKASCENFGRCEDIPESWIRSVYRSSLANNFFGFGLKALQEKDPDLYSNIMKVLNHG